MHDVGKLVDFEDDDKPPEVMFNCFFFAYFAMQVYFMVWISDAVIEEANKTGRILCRTASFQIDKPTKECVSCFSNGSKSRRILCVNVFFSSFKFYSDRNLFIEYSAS